MGNDLGFMRSHLSRGLRLQVGRPQRAIWCGVCAALVAAGALLGTSPWTPMTWDEGDAIRRAESIRDWFSHAFRMEASGPPALSREGITRGWPFTVRREGHPALYGAIIALGRSLSPGFLDPLTRYRFGPIVLFAAAMGAVTYRVARIAGVSPAVAAFLCILLQPRLFAHAHFASFDGPLTAWWMLAWACSPFFSTMRTSHKRTSRSDLARIFLWGLILGATMSSKATGWLVVVPFLFWAIGQRQWSVLFRTIVGILIGLGTFVVLNPPLWYDPISGVLRFFQLNLSRHERPDLNITTFFLGELYNLDYPLPWYNTLFWTAIVVPIPILALFIVGLVYWVRTSRRSILTLVVLHWLTLIVVRAIPGTPPHDGIRLFLPAFPFLGILAAFGFRFVTSAPIILLRRWAMGFLPLPRRQRSIRAAQPLAETRSFSWRRNFLHTAHSVLQTVMWLVVLTPLVNLICFGPQWLSYYNGLIGGLPGATAAGMEPTYYWDGLDREVFLWLEIHCLETEKVYYSACPWTNLRLLQEWGVLKRAFATSPAEAQWYVVQNRPGAWFPEDKWLFTHGEAAFTKYPGRGPMCPWVGRVPVVKIFPIREYFRACQAVHANRAMSDQ